MGNVAPGRNCRRSTHSGEKLGEEVEAVEEDAEDISLFRLPSVSRSSFSDNRRSMVFNNKDTQLVFSEKSAGESREISVFRGDEYRETSLLR